MHSHQDSNKTPCNTWRLGCHESRGSAKRIRISEFEFGLAGRSGNTRLGIQCVGVKRNEKNPDVVGPPASKCKLLSNHRFVKLLARSMAMLTVWCHSYSSNDIDNNDDNSSNDRKNDNAQGCWWTIVICWCVPPVGKWSNELPCGMQHAGRYTPDMAITLSSQCVKGYGMDGIIMSSIVFFPVGHFAGW